MLHKDELNKSEKAEALHYYSIPSKTFYGSRTIHKLRSGLPRETPWERKEPDKTFVTAECGHTKVDTSTELISFNTLYTE